MGEKITNGRCKACVSFRMPSCEVLALIAKSEGRFEQGLAQNQDLEKLEETKQAELANLFYNAILRNCKRLSTIFI